MDYKDSDICVCGHEFDNHDLDEDGWCLVCMFSDGFYGDGVNDCRQFKLDNLKYVEAEAKRKNLI